MRDALQCRSLEGCRRARRRVLSPCRWAQVVPAGSVAALLRELPLKRLRGLGGDFGASVQEQLGVSTCGEGGGTWGIATVGQPWHASAGAGNGERPRRGPSPRINATTAGELWGVPMSRLEGLFGDKRALWLARLAWGVDTADDIKPRVAPQSISCGKTFRCAPPPAPSSRSLRVLRPPCDMQQRR